MQAQNLSNSSQNHNKVKTCELKALGLLRSLDQFGVPISLTYKNEPVLKSHAGGVATILSRVIVLAFMIVQIQDVYNRVCTIQTSIYKRDLNSDFTEFNLTEQIFDIGLKLEYIFFEKDPTIQANLDQYVYLQLSQNEYQWIKNSKGQRVQIKYKQKVELTKCEQGIYDSFQCPERVNFQIGGSFAVQKSKFIQVAIRDCNQTYLNEKYNKTKQCKSKDEISKVAQFLKLHIITQNSYFDAKSFETISVKKSLDLFYLMSIKDKSIYYYMLLSQNKILRKDNMVYGPDIEEKFIETKIDHNIVQELNSTDPYNNAYIGVYIMLNDEVKQIERKVFNVLDALKNTGGFISKLNFTVKKNFRMYLRQYGFCRTRNSNSAFKDKLYENGLMKVHRELDIRNISRELRTLKFITNTILDKYQRYMLPLFRANLLNNQPKMLSFDIDDNVLEESLANIIIHEDVNKTFYDKEFRLSEEIVMKMRKPATFVEKMSRSMKQHRDQNNFHNSQDKDNELEIEQNLSNESDEEQDKSQSVPEQNNRKKELLIDDDIFQKYQPNKSEIHQAKPENQQRSFDCLENSQKQLFLPLPESKEDQSEPIDLENIQVQIQPPDNQLKKDKKTIQSNVSEINYYVEDEEEIPAPALDFIKF
ncbi:UNKNOWN [Stylonychia lemnae]|uniref:Uncharacterized protein n=1 Tax=Stylonychia lemnae TaxID=5949 RepID=A0A078AR46_STYLE|nr:UNKNOWN [Stylonychia lemnae]|eukprot:CDW84441.1 UNKNOWN [Stylonychia lemnae]